MIVHAAYGRVCKYVFMLYIFVYECVVLFMEVCAHVYVWVVCKLLSLYVCIIHECMYLCIYVCMIFFFVARINVHTAYGRICKYVFMLYVFV